ncbi:MAG: hypothetical protein KKF98_00145 [Bacteroidetes bacterium]|nr:hypothetical protein [Bacteroidota bacterium]
METHPSIYPTIEGINGRVQFSHTLASIMKKSTKYIIWTLGILGFLFSLLWIYIDFYEVYGISSGELINNYPWGNESSNPWYYGNSTTYWIYCLISGLLNLSAAVFILNGMFRKNHKQMIIGLIITTLTFLIMFMSAYFIEPPA